MIDDEELDAIAIESSHTIEIDSFVPRAQIDERYFDSPYYICPNDKVGQDAFAVIHEAMRGKGMVALGRIVLAKRERVIMLQAWEKGLMGTTLRYPYELRATKDYFGDIPDVQIPAEMLKLAEHILETKETNFEPSAFVDRYEEAVVAMLKKKQAGLPTTNEPQSAPAANVVNLMDALRRSIEGEPALAPNAQRKPAEGQRERRPIAGKVNKEEKKSGARSVSKRRGAG
jgi:DNA end-binding protein Ku